MKSSEPQQGKRLWGRAILNGLMAWAIGFVLYLIPGLVVGFRMGFDLGPKLQDSSAVSQQIGQTVSAMYRENVYLMAAYMVVMAVLVFWRARAISRKSPGRGVINGAIVGAVPAVIAIVSLAAGKGNYLSVIEAVVYLLVGALSGNMRKDQPAVPTEPPVL